MYLSIYAYYSYKKWKKKKKKLISNFLNHNLEEKFVCMQVILWFSSLCVCVCVCAQVCVCVCV